MKLGKPLPPVKEIVPPNEDEINLIVAKWNANCPPYYRGLLEAQSAKTPNATAKFLYDKAKMQYIDRATGRVLSHHEIAEAFLAYSKKVSEK